MVNFKSTLQARRTRAERQRFLQPILQPAIACVLLLIFEVGYFGYSGSLISHRDVIIETSLGAACLLLALLLRAQTEQRKQDEQGLKLFNAELTGAILALDESIRKQEEAEKRKQEIIATVSHELRSPLSSLLCTLEMLHFGVYSALPARAADKVEASISDLRRLLDLLNDLLDLEKMEAGKLVLNFGMIKPMTAIKQAADSLQSFADVRNVKIRIDCSENLTMWGDSGRISQVMVNLLSNAIKYSPPGETVEVSAFEASPLIRIEVRDHGPGISVEHQERIFEKFEQVEATEKEASSGLGLAICQEIVTAFGGTIGVTSTVGEGTCFWLFLPKHPPEAQPQLPDRGLPESLSSAIWLAKLEDATKKD